MARKKYNKEKLVSEKETFIEEVIKPAVDNHYREKVLDWSGKGYNANQIASMLKLHKHVVENIINNG